MKSELLFYSSIALVELFLIKFTLAVSWPVALLLAIILGLSTCIAFKILGDL